MIDIEKKIDEKLNQILREKVEEYFNGPANPKKKIKIAQEPMEAIQRVGDEITDIESKLDPRTKHGLEKVKMAISQGARSISTISEYAKCSNSAARKYLKILIVDEKIMKDSEGGYILRD